MLPSMVADFWFGEEKKKSAATKEKKELEEREIQFQFIYLVKVKVKATNGNFSLVERNDSQGLVAPPMGCHLAGNYGSHVVSFCVSFLRSLVLGFLWSLGPRFPNIGKLYIKTLRITS